MDANVFISFMLHPTPDRIPARIAIAALAQEYDLLVSDVLLDEITRKVTNKPFLKERIPQTRLATFIRELRASATTVRELDSPIPRETRDKYDDYLIAHAIAENVDVLVSGDRHLLDEKGRFTFQILSPAEFVATYLTAD